MITLISLRDIQKNAQTLTKNRDIKITSNFKFQRLTILAPSRSAKIHSRTTTTARPDNPASAAAATSPPQNSPAGFNKDTRPRAISENLARAWRGARID